MQPSVCSCHIDRGVGADTLWLVATAKTPSPPEHTLAGATRAVLSLRPYSLPTCSTRPRPMPRRGVRLSDMLHLCDRPRQTSPRPAHRLPPPRRNPGQGNTPCNHRSVLATLIGSRGGASLKDFHPHPQPREGAMENVGLRWSKADQRAIALIQLISYFERA